MDRVAEVRTINYGNKVLDLEFRESVSQPEKKFLSEQAIELMTHCAIVGMSYGDLREIIEENLECLFEGREIRDIRRRALRWHKLKS